METETAPVIVEDSKTETSTKEGSEMAKTETDAKAEKPKKAAAKTKAPKKAAAKPKVAAKANGKAPVTKKGAKAAKPVKAAAKKPAPKKAATPKLKVEKDKFGFRKDSKKSVAAAMYSAKKGKVKGATLAEVQKATGSKQLNLLKELEKKDYKVLRIKENVDGGRPVTRYYITA